MAVQYMCCYTGFNQLRGWKRESVYDASNEGRLPVYDAGLRQNEV